VNPPAGSLKFPQAVQVLVPLLCLALCRLIFPGPVAGAANPEKYLPPPTVFVGIAPHRWLCRRIGGERVRVELLLPPGKSPASFVPTPAQVRELSRARLYFQLGLPFERELLKRLALMPRHPEIIDLQAGIELRPMADSGPGKRVAASAGRDPHTWLDPRLAARQAATMAAALSRIDPDGSKLYAANLARLEKELNDLYRELKKQLEPLSGSTLLVYHPAFGYFAAAFGLRQAAIEAAGKQPRGRALAELIQKARRLKVRAIFVEPQFDRRSAEKIAATLNCTVVAIDPLAADYSANLKRIAATISRFPGPR
jgi:zinc transport system substrate-binding protein